jgi:hypothetical protein
MKRNFSLSIVTASLLTTSAIASDISTLYQDPETGVIYGKESSNLEEFQDFKNAKDLDLEIQKIESDLAKLKLKMDKGPKITSVTNSKSPDFLLGKETSPNLKIVSEDNKDMYVKIGTRLQGTFESKTTEKGDVEETANDAYLRRVRFEITTGFDKYTSFTMDVRNDKANYQNKGEETFNVGDAYLKIKKPFGDSLVNFKLYRGKIDVSRTETVKSAYVIFYERPHIADEAAQYITHNRRGTNIQMYGDFEKKFHYQVAIGDGVYSGKFKDATGGSFKGSGFVQEQFFYGGKIILSPFDGWEETKRTETYFGEGKHFQVGASYWNSSDINFNDGVDNRTIDHELLNLELSAHYEGLFVQAEYFSFDGVVKKWGEAETGNSDGWYATGEYVFKDLNYIAPFFRYEKWNKWEGEDGYDFTSTVAGLNWYLRGNSTKVGLSFQKDEYGENIGDKTETSYRLTSQWFF